MGARVSATPPPKLTVSGGTSPLGASISGISGVSGIPGPSGVGSGYYSGTGGIIVTPHTVPYPPTYASPAPPPTYHRELEERVRKLEADLDLSKYRHSSAEVRLLSAEATIIQLATELRRFGKNAQAIGEIVETFCQRISDLEETYITRDAADGEVEAIIRDSK